MTTSAPSFDPEVDFSDHRLASRPRLSLPFSGRVTFCTAISCLAGFGLGASHGSQTAGFRFRAEHAHKLPQSSTGWYLYHKSKNYNMMFGGVKEGLRMGGKVGFFVASFFTIEEAVDRVKGTRDFVSTVVGGLGVAGGFSLLNRLPLPVAARTARLGLVVGLGYGLLQDALAVARGRNPEYVDFLLGKSADKRGATALISP
ncbi:MAG: hypothetical protein M4579_004148 [Chaenotheca gracillima]|nr:MAG: hypothetical protein M4579_004148 [Chaenotheca gracillima]